MPSFLSELERCRKNDKHYPLAVEWHYEMEESIGGDYAPSAFVVKRRWVSKVWCPNCHTTEQL